MFDFWRIYLGFELTLVAPTTSFHPDPSTNPNGLIQITRRHHLPSRYFSERCLLQLIQHHPRRQSHQ
jgi:hypothetical protein